MTTNLDMLLNFLVSDVQGRFKKSIPILNAEINNDNS